MTHVDYIDFFKTCAKEHVQLQHDNGDGKIAFCRVVESAPNPFKPVSFVEEFLSFIRTKGKVPMLMVIAFEAIYDYTRDVKCEKIIDGAFLVLDIPSNKTDFDEIEKTLDKTEIIGEQILARLIDFVEADQCQILDTAGTGQEKIGPIADHYFGTKFYVRLKVRANNLLNHNINDNNIWVSQ